MAGQGSQAGRIYVSTFSVHTVAAEMRNRGSTSSRKKKISIGSKSWPDREEKLWGGRGDVLTQIRGSTGVLGRAEAKLTVDGGIDVSKWTGGLGYYV